MNHEKIDVDDLEFRTVRPKESLEAVVLREKNLKAVAEWLGGALCGDHIVIRGVNPPFFTTQKGYPGDIAIMNHRRGEAYLMSVARAKEIYEFL